MSEAALTVAKAESFQVPDRCRSWTRGHKEVFRVLYRPDPQQEHQTRVLSCDWPVFDLVWPSRLSEPGRHRADHGRSLHRAAPGLRADGQTAYGRDPNVLQLSHGERRTRYESCSGGQDRAFFAQGRQNAGVRPGRKSGRYWTRSIPTESSVTETRRFLPPLPILAAGSAPP